MYSQLFWEHARCPRNRLALSGAVTGESQFARCGDRLTLYLKITNGVIEQATFEARACAAVIAVASIMTNRVVGLALDGLSGLSILELDQELGGLPQSKRHAYLMFIEALCSASERQW